MADSSLDRLTAVLRVDEGDAQATLEALAGRLEIALPERVTVTRRRRRLLGRERVVSALEVDLGETRYELALVGEGSGGLEPTRRTVVRGVAIRSERPGLEDWAATLAADLEALAAESGRGRAAVGRLLELG